jgi:hypothetical protein
MQPFVHAKGQLVYYLLSDFWRKHLSISAIEYFFYLHCYTLKILLLEVEVNDNEG